MQNAQLLKRGGSMTECNIAWYDTKTQGKKKRKEKKLIRE